jgi:membrane-associated phospholipid phosphatase
VLGAGFVCYGTLPWLVSRPPRLIDPAATEPHPISAVNAFILRRVSHQLNTFPSGHVAVSVAAALNTLAVWLPAGVVFSVVAVGIAVGAAVGRYHYVIDVLLGLLVGVAFTLIGWGI